MINFDGSGNPVFSRISGCWIKSGMTEKDIYKQTRIIISIWETGMFYIAGPKDIMDGKVADVYFVRTMEVLRAKKIDKWVKAESEGIRAYSNLCQWGFG